VARVPQANDRPTAAPLHPHAAHAAGLARGAHPAMAHAAMPQHVGAPVYPSAGGFYPHPYPNHHYLDPSATPTAGAKGDGASLGASPRQLASPQLLPSPCSHDLSWQETEPDLCAGVAV